MSNEMQCYTVYFIWKLVYMFRVVLPSIIRSAKQLYDMIYLLTAIGFVTRWQYTFTQKQYIEQHK